MRTCDHWVAIRKLSLELSRSCLWQRTASRLQVFNNNTYGFTVTPK
jgi:hypothetical protein